MTTSRPLAMVLKELRLSPEIESYQHTIPFLEALAPHVLNYAMTPNVTALFIKIASV